MQPAGELIEKNTLKGIDTIGILILILLVLKKTGLVMGGEYKIS